MTPMYLFLTALLAATGLNDLSCSSTDETAERAASDVIIVLDTQWPYATIQPALA